MSSLNLLPLAGGLANQAFASSQQLGSDFVEVLSRLAKPVSGENSNTELDATKDSGQTSVPFGSNHARKTGEWCRKLADWLRDHNVSGDFKIQIGLDSLDQPQIAALGPSANTIEQAVEQDPTLLQEFRELALDRLAEQASGRPPVLKFTQQDGQFVSEWI